VFFNSSGECLVSLFRKAQSSSPSAVTPEPAIRSLATPKIRVSLSSSILGQQNRFTQFSSFALLVLSKCIQIVRSNLEMPHDHGPCPAGNPPSLSALTAERRFAATAVWSVAKNHSAIIATTTMPGTTACENQLSLSTQHADIRMLHK
jgi:hypothetical protein